MRTPKLLASILDKASSLDVNDLRGPTTDVKEGEEVIGEVPPELRALWGVMNRARGDHDEVCAKINSESFDRLRDGERREMTRKHSLALLELQLARECLMVALRAQFLDHAEAPCIAIRNGWKVVTCIEMPVIVAEVSILRQQLRPRPKPGQERPLDVRLYSTMPLGT